MIPTLRLVFTRSMPLPDVSVCAELCGSCCPGDCTTAIRAPDKTSPVESHTTIVMARLAPAFPLATFDDAAFRVLRPHPRQISILMSPVDLSCWKNRTRPHLMDFSLYRRHWCISRSGLTWSKTNGQSSVPSCPRILKAPMRVAVHGAIDAKYATECYGFRARKRRDRIYPIGTVRTRQRTVDFRTRHAPG